jgi:hypothetical protein
VQQRHRSRRGLKGAQHEMGENRRILAGREQHHGIARSGDIVTQNMHRFRLEGGRMGWRDLHASTRRGSRAVFASLMQFSQHKSPV